MTKLSWPDQHPFHTVYGDSYYSRDGGLAESEYVFLQHNQLEQRWQRQARFGIGELGFGTGLNFLLTLRLYFQHPNPPKRLDYIACEEFLLDADELRRAHAHWPQLQEISEQLLQTWGEFGPGSNIRSFADGRVRLILLHGDAQEELGALDAQIDAWYLDGFAPARNPELWSAELMHCLARKTTEGGSFATYSAAGQVRRNLQAAGFEVQKGKGFGRKREMLHGRLPQAPAPESPPWFRTLAHSNLENIQILGGGIAGCCLARRLAEAGISVNVAHQPRQEAQHEIPAYLVRRYPEKKPSASSRFYDLAYQTALNFYAQHCPQAIRKIRAQTADGDMDALQLDAHLARQALLDHSLISLKPARPTEINIHCTGQLDAAIQKELAAQLQNLAGQAIRLSQSQDEEAATGELQRISRIAAEEQLIGATYRRDRDDLAIDAAESAQLLDSAHALWPQTTEEKLLGAHTGLRVASPDHLPLIGPWPDSEFWREHYAMVHHGKPWSNFPPAQNHAGQWLNLAHGSRGATAAPLAAELIYAQMLGLNTGIPRDIVHAVHPGRFLLRALRRNRL